MPNQAIWRIKLNWDAIGAIAELVGAAAVVASLSFLAFELRRQRQAAQSHALDVGTSKRTAITAKLLEDTELSRITWTCFVGTEHVPAHEYARFATYMYILFLECELAHRNRLSGEMDDVSWAAFEAATQWWLKFPGVRTWWQSPRQTGFSPQFMSYVDLLIETTPSDNSDAIRIAASYKTATEKKNIDS
jgi:hypothetical protein